MLEWITTIARLLPTTSDAGSTRMPPITPMITRTRAIQPTHSELTEHATMFRAAQPRVGMIVCVWGGGVYVCVKRSKRYHMRGGRCTSMRHGSEKVSEG